MITTRTMTLTNDELDTIAKAHDLLQDIDSKLFEHEENDFFFDREEVSRFLLTASSMMEEAMIKLVGYNKWVNYEVKE